MISKLVDQLSCDVRACFGVPGSGRSSEIIEKFLDKNIPFYSTYHESSAAIMAGSFGEVSNIASCISIKGPGLANMFPGLANNYFEDRATISLSENFDDGVKKYHKKLDHSFVQKVSKYSSSLNNESLPNLVEIAKAPRSGVVHIDLCKSSLSHNTINDIYSNSLPKKITHPAIIFGKNCLKYGVFNYNLSIPVFTTPSAKGYVDENKNCSFGVYCGCGNNESILKHSDCIIAVEVPKYELLSWSDKLYHITFNEFEEIVHVLKDKSWGHKTDLSAPNYWSPSCCFVAMNNIKKDYHLIVDTGLFCVMAEYYWKASPRRRLIGSLNSRFMGTAIPTAIGVSIAGHEVVCCFGDGGISYLTELPLVKNMRLPICFVSFMDGRYSSLISNNPVITTKNNSCIKIFEASDIPSYSCNNIESLNILLSKWDNAPMYIECNFESKKYLESAKKLRG